MLTPGSQDHIITQLHILPPFIRYQTKNSKIHSSHTQKTNPFCLEPGFHKRHPNLNQDCLQVHIRESDSFLSSSCVIDPGDTSFARKEVLKKVINENNHTHPPCAAFAFRPNSEIVNSSQVAFDTVQGKIFRFRKRKQASGMSNYCTVCESPRPRYPPRPRFDDWPFPAYPPRPL